MAIVVGTKKDKAPRESVTFGYMRDDEFETIELQAVLSLDAAGMRRTLLASRRESADVLDALFSAVAKMLDNTDGVPHGWRPKPVRRSGAASTEDVESFRVPSGENKGDIVPMTEVAKYLKPEAGSSRARWNYLINEDEGAVVDSGDITKLFEQLISATANRPTVASS
jgi:hypothetical protein